MDRELSSGDAHADVAAEVRRLYGWALDALPPVTAANAAAVRQAFRAGIFAAAVLERLRVAQGCPPALCPACDGLGTTGRGASDHHPPFECDRCGGSGLARPGDRAAGGLVADPDLLLAELRERRRAFEGERELH